MKENFDIILGDYLVDKSSKVDATRNYYKSLINDIPELLRNIINDDSYKIDGSCGIGNKAQIPWVGVFNKNITESATFGIYICYLFKSDMTGFYLTIMQGITTFKNEFSDNPYEAAEKTTNYFKNKISDDYFSKRPIDLVVNKGSLGYGYESTTIVSKYYETGKYSSEELVSDFLKIKKIYDEICLNVDSLSYREVVKNIVENERIELMTAEEADELIEQTILEITDLKSAEIMVLTEIPIPKLKSEKYKGLTQKKIRKTDYIKKAKKDLETGLRGEQLVIEYEKEKLIKLGREDLAKNIKWVSNTDDSAGYDIVSYEVNGLGEAKEIYIEVKTTEASEKNVFYVSQNELDVLNAHINKYWFYRVSNIKTKPKFYKISGQDFNERFNVTPLAYAVELKVR